ncbi:MAG: GNAT family N-acetyltransferase [Acidimicrobiia bacterium]
MEATHFTIRRERPEDMAAIHAVVAAAFEPEPVAEMVEAIRKSKHYTPEMALVAEVEGAIVGHVMISGATLHSGDTEHPIVMLSPLAVSEPQRRQGIGAALVRAVCSIADERGEPLIIVEGDPAYYGRFGFEHSLLHGIEIDLPDWAPPEAAQVMRLANYDSLLTGKVIYPPAFDIVAE